MKSVCISDRMIGFFVLLVAIACLLALVGMAGCGPAQQQPGAEPQWPPQVSVESAHLRGTVEIDTPAGPVSVELETGYASGDGSASVRRVDVSTEVVLLVAGTQQRTVLATTGQRVGEDWAQCAAIEAAVSVSGIAITVRAVPPWLHPSCGPASVSLETPFGTLELPKAKPAEEEEPASASP